MCYHSEDVNDKAYGPECAAKAIEALHGRDMGSDKILYVKEALKMSERE